MQAILNRLFDISWDGPNWPCIRQKPVIEFDFEYRPNNWPEPYTRTNFRSDTSCPGSEIRPDIDLDFGPGIRSIPEYKYKININEF